MIDKITFAVSDMESMTAFYADILGVTFQPTEMFGHTLFVSRYQSIELMFCPKDLAGVEANTNTLQLRFLVDDVAASYAKGVTHNVATLSEPGLIEGSYQASMRDPDGNSLELKQIPHEEPESMAPPAAYMYAWEYEILPHRTQEFLAAYGAEGEWVRLFRRSPGYERTELHQHRNRPNQFLTLDFWKSAAAYEAFRKEHADDFVELDKRCEAFTVAEREIGTFNRS